MAARKKSVRKKSARKTGKSAARKAMSRARKPARKAAPKRAAKAAKRVVKSAKRKAAPAKARSVSLALPAGVLIDAPLRPGYEAILSRPALDFIVELQRKFGARVEQLLAKRQEVQARLDRGEKPDFLAETAKVRAGDWTVAPVPSDIQDRRVEITGPVDRKMVINALNCGASVFMADFEDANTPTWANQIEGQINLRDAVRRAITFTDPESGKSYKLNDKTAVLFVRPRGWHLPEKHVLVDGAPMSGALFDFGLYFFHNAKALLERGSGPYFYLPKMESHLEARLWNDVFVHAQQKLGLKRGTIKATVLIETIMAAFEMDEILYELREHSAGLNCRALGLHLQLHQEIPQRPERGDARPRAGHDDHAPDALLRPAPDRDVPQAQRARDGRHGGADPDQGRSGRQQGGDGQGLGRQDARGDRRA